MVPGNDMVESETKYTGPYATCASKQISCRSKNPLVVRRSECSSANCQRLWRQWIRL